jgi:transposase
VSSPSWVPPAKMRQIRDWTRARSSLVAARTRFKQGIENCSKAPWSSCRSWPQISSGYPGGPWWKGSSPVGATPRAVAEALDDRFSGHHARLLRLQLDQSGHLDASIIRGEITIDELMTALPAAAAVYPSAGTAAGTTYLAGRRTREI